MKKRVAIQGIRASFHEEAAYKFFGKDIEVRECNSFKQTCEDLRHNQADYAVMAIENSIAGSLLTNYNLLRDYHFYVTGEVYLPIQLHLLAMPGVGFEQIKYIHSHPIAIRQCEYFFEDYPHIEVIEKADTAACAKNIAEQKLTDTAAIANLSAAKEYGLTVLHQRIEASKKNYTRFLVLSKGYMENTEANKASICFQVRHDIGSLARVLSIFADNNINLSKIQSMPVLGRPNEYNFYVDLEWTDLSDYDRAMKKALKNTTSLTVMGEYRKND